MSNNGPHLVGPHGEQLHPTTPKLIVIKQPKGVKINPQIAAMTGKQTGCNVIVIPMDCELMMGELALKQIMSTHIGIHAVLDLPNIHFDKPELECILHGLKSTEPLMGADASAVQALKRIEDLLTV